MGSLLERSHELAVIDRVLTRDPDLAGAGTVVVLGSAGIGKTRLLSELRRHAGGAGRRVLSARGAELETTMPFGVARQLFERTLSRLSAGEHTELLRGPAAHALPVLRGDPYSDSGTAADDRDSFALHALYWLVANLAEHEPLVVSVDDAQWADDASLRFLSYLAGRLADLPVVLALAVRSSDPGSADPSLQTVITNPQTVSLRPAPLSVEAVHELVTAQLSEGAETDFSAACHTATGGNPYLVHEVLATLSAEGAKPDAASAQLLATASPGAISRSVLFRLARMGTGQIALARAVAVLGAPTRLDEAAQLAGLGFPAAANAADSLVASEVFRRGGALEFVHPLVHSAVQHDMGHNTLADAHGRAARILDGRAAPRDRVAAHLLAANPCGDPWVVERLRQAADVALARGASDVAVTYLDRAVSEPPQGDGHRVWHELGSALARRGEYARTVQALQRALDTAGDARQRADVARTFARVLVPRPGSTRTAVEVLDSAVAALDDDDHDVGVDLESAIALAGFVSLDGMRAAAARLPRFVDEEDLRFVAHRSLQHAVFGGPAATAVSLANRALREMRRRGGDVADTVGFHEALAALIGAGELEQAHQLGTDAVAEARARGSSFGVGLASCFRAQAALRLGLLADAEADGRTYVELLGDMFGIGPAFLVDALVERGELDAAEAALTARTPHPAEADQSGFCFLLAGRGSLRLAQGAIRQALDDFLACGSLLAEWDTPSPPAVGTRTPGFVQWRPQAATALAALGEQVEASRLIDEEVELCRSFGAPGPLGRALRVAGSLQGGQAGIELLQQATSLLKPSSEHLEHAHALVGLGGALRRSGRRVDARHPLREGLALARNYGAMPLAERAFDELTATGARPRKILRTGVDTLTSTERRIAQLAVQGHSNRAIAQAQFVTVRTVETHLRHVYVKLGITSRDKLGHALNE